MSSHGISGNDTSPIKEAKRPELAQVAGKAWGQSGVSAGWPDPVSFQLCFPVRPSPAQHTDGCSASRLPSTSLPRPAERGSPFSASLSHTGWPGSCA